MVGDFLALKNKKKGFEASSVEYRENKGAINRSKKQ